MATVTLSFDELYKSKVRPELQQKFNYANSMQLPQIEKVCINMGVGKEVVANSKVIEDVVRQLELLSGQKPVITLAKKSIAGFKLREGMPIGCKVTLRRKRMYEFLERLVLVALPRLREFRGFSVKNFDGKGNLSLGLKEQIVFPEIDYDKVDRVRGLDITIVTSAKTDEEAKFLLQGFHIPFSN